MSASQSPFSVFHGRYDHLGSVRVGASQPKHGREPLLLGCVLREQPPHVRRDPEQAIIEQVGCRSRDRLHLGEAVLHELHLRGHHRLLLAHAGIIAGIACGDVL